MTAKRMHSERSCRRGCFFPRVGKPGRKFSNHWKRTLVLTVLSFHIGLSCVYSVDDLNLRGDFNAWGTTAMTKTGGVFRVTIQETTTGYRRFKFDEDGTWDPDWGNGDAVSIGHIDTLYANGANGSNIVQDSYYYTYGVLNPSAGVNSQNVIQETTNTPISISTVDDDHLAAGTNAVTVTITTSAEPSGELIFVRYTTNSWSASAFAQASGSDTNWSAEIPALSPETHVDYYILTTTFSSPTHSDADLQTIAYGNNNGANYTYTTPIARYVDASRPDNSGDGSSWATAKQTIQAAADISNDGDTIWVTNGIYNLGSRPMPGYTCSNRVVITNAITLQSLNGPEVTVIEGAPDTGGGTPTNGPASIRGVYMVNATLSGFTITNGWAMDGWSTVNGPDREGGGVWMTNSVVTNCVISGCRAYGAGGAIVGKNNCEIRNCEIFGNVATNGGAGGVQINTDCLMQDCHVYDNYAASIGGGLYVGSACTVNNCIIERNRAAPSTIIDPMGAGGMIVQGTANNCLVVSNSTTAKGGAATIFGTGHINNCTLVGNSADVDAGGVFFYNATLGELANCIAWDNSSPTNTFYWNTAAYITNCCAPDGITNGVNGCTTNNPLLQNEYTLTANSPCFNTGANNLAPTNATPVDLAGGKRIAFNTVDMGAYELQYILTTNTAPAGGGTSMIISNDALGTSGDISNVTICGAVATITDQGDNWVEVTLGSSTDAYQSITGDILIQSPTVGDSIFADAFTYLRGTNLLFFADASKADDGGDGRTWATAKKTIQAATDLAWDNDTVWVTNGIYNLGSVPMPGYTCSNRVVITNAITLQSVNGPEVTSIEGAPDTNGGSPTNGPASIRGVYLGDGATLSGFTITNGWNQDRWTGPDAPNQQGGGIWATNSVVTNCIIRNCQAYSVGGGIIAQWGAEIRNCEIINNVCTNGNGGGALLGMTASMQDCHIHDNRAQVSGGGVFVAAGCSVNNSVIEQNVVNTPSLSDTAGGGGLYIQGTANNCLVVSNSTTARGGGAIIHLLGQINNCTLVENSADVDAGGVYFYVAIQGKLANSIIWNNSSPSNTFSWSSIAVITNCCAPDGVTNGVNGCTTNDPAFADHYRLTKDSPCFNTGANILAPTNATPNDLAGNDRIMFGTVDMGAYELSYQLSSYAGPADGGNTITITNSHLGNGSDITNVTVSGSTATIEDQGSNWVTITLGPAADNDASGDVVIQSTSVGETTFTGVYSYNPKGFIGDESGWQDTAGLPVVLDTGNAVVYSNRLYSIGGTVAGASSTNVYRFDGTNWTPIVGLPGPRRAMGCVVYDGLLYAIGGIDASSVQYTNVYTFDGTSWSETAGLPYAVCEMGCAVWNGKIYCIAGGGGGSEIASVCSFDGSSWTMETSLPGTRTAIQAQTLNDTLYALGGYDGAPYTNVWTYDGSAWSEVPGYPIACCAMGTTVRAGLIYSMGGMSGPHLTNCWTFDGSTWTEIEGLPRTLYAPAGATYNGQVYCVGGHNSGSGTTNVLTYPSYTGGVSPENGSVDGGFQVTINGVNLGDGSDITNVTLCGVAVASIDSQSATQVVVTAAAGTPGQGDVAVYSTSYGVSVKTDGFSYYQLSSTVGPNAGGNTLIITNGYFGAITNVLVGATSVSPLQSGDNWFTITLPASTNPAGGTVDLTVQTSDNGETTLADAYTYNPAGQLGLYGVGEWEQVASLPYALNKCAMGTWQNRIITAGGHSGSTLTNVFLFDGESWTEAPGLPVPTYVNAGALLDGCFYSIGGYDSSGITNVYGFDGTNWTEVAGLPVDRYWAACTVAGGYIYLIGGDASNVVAATNVYRFDGSTWEEITGLSSSNAAGAAVTLDDQPYLAGGRSYGWWYETTNVCLFNGTAWANQPGLPQPREGCMGGTVLDEIYVVGGQADSGNWKTNMWRYNGTSWTEVPGIPETLGGTYNGTAYDRWLYVIGQAANKVYRYTPLTQLAIPFSGSNTGGYQVVINGTNLGNGGDITNVTLCGFSVDSIDSQSATQVVVTAGTASFIGLGEVRVYSTSYGETFAIQGFRYTGPNLQVLGTNGALIASGEAASDARGTQFGYRMPNTTVTNTFSLTNNGTASLTISGYGITGSSFEIGGVPASVDAGTVSNFTIAYAPTAPGSHTGSLTISNDSLIANYIVNLAGSCFTLSTNAGPYAGGNSITITNGTLGDGADITNVTVGGVSATITGQGVNWVTITLPEASTAGSVDVLVQSVSVGDTLFADAYTYNPAGQIGLVVEDWSLWQPVDGTPSAMTYGGAGILDNDLFVAGGVRGYSSAATNAASFDGEDWTLEPVHPLQATDFGSAIYSGAFYTVAGHAGLSYITNVVYFDGSSWTETTGLPEALGMLGAGVLDGYLYSVGGTDGSANNARTNVFRFDGSSWTEVAGLPEARRGLGVATFNGALYALGGQEDGSSTAHTNVYRFDGSSWAEVTGLPQAKSSFAVSTLRGKLYVIAGLVGFNGATTVHCYDGTNWMTATNYPAAVYGLAAAELDGYLYGVSGTTDDYFDYLTNAYRYPWRDVDSGVSPDSGSWTGGYPVVITGTNLCNGADATNVTLCGVSVASIDNQSLTQLVVTAGQTASMGLGDVRVYSTSYGETVKSNAFTYLGSDIQLSGSPFNHVKLGTPVTNIFTLTNSGNATLLISTATNDGTGAAYFDVSELTGLAVEAGTASNVPVVFTPGSAGSFTPTCYVINNSATPNYSLGLSGSAYALSSDNGPYAGGNSITLTNGTLGDGSDITNVTVGDVTATITGQGVNWVTITLPTASAAGSVSVRVQSVSFGDTLFTEAYTYNPAGQIGGTTYDWSAWQEVAGLPETVYYVHGAVLNGAYYTVGGEVNGSISTNVFRFDGAAWTEVAGLPAARRLAAVGSYSNAIYCVAGDNADSDETNTVFKFDGTNWTAVAPLPTSRYSLCTKAYNGYLYSIAGNPNPRTNVYRYNGTDWEEVEGVPSNQVNASATVAGGYLYSAGGYQVGNAFRFDGTNWSDLGAMPDVMNFGGAGNLNDQPYFYGGYDGTFNASTNVFRYDGTNWEQIVGFPEARYGFAGGEYDGSIYVVGGYGVVAATNVYRYPGQSFDPGVVPSSGSWTGDYQVVITGSNLGDGSDITNVTLCGVNVDSIDSQSSTQVVVTAGQAPIAGAGDVRVYSTSYGESVKSNAFEYLREQQAALIFTPTTPQTYQTTNALTTSGGSGTGAVSYAMVSGPGQIIDSTNLTVTSGTGTIEISATKAQDDRYFETIVTGTVSAAKANASITWSDLLQTYDGTAKSPTYQTSPTGLTVELTFDGNAWAPTNVGTYAVTGTINDADYQGSSNILFTINQATATVYLADLAQTYDSTARSVTATSDPSGLTVEFTYDGNAWAPTNAGSYAITGTINDVNYQGFSSDTLVVDKANQTISAFLPTNDSVFAWLDPVGLSAVGGGSGNPVTFAVADGPGQISGATNLGFTGVGAVQVTANQAGNANYNAAPPLTNRYVAQMATATYYVDAARPDDSGLGLSWATAKRTIQAAVDLAANGSTVWVTNGIYDEGGTVTPGFSSTNRVCITNAITIRSINGPSTTLIKGATGSNGSNYVDAVRGVYMNGGSLSGFTIANGFTMNSGNHPFDRSGGGAFLYRGGVVSNCIITGCQATDDGGGAFVYSGGYIVNCIIQNNISVNGSGAGVFNVDCDIDNCLVDNNHAANYGGGIYLEAGTSRNCTIVNNTADNTGGGLFACFFSSAYNCIAWDNTSPGNNDIDDSSVTIAYCCSSDGITNGANGCTTNAPLLKSNYTLTADSPCFNTGANLYAPTNKTPVDLGGNSRIMFGTVDMGAYELQYQLSSDIGPYTGDNTIIITNGNLGNGSDITNVLVCGAAATVNSQGVNWVQITLGPSPNKEQAVLGDVVIQSTSIGDSSIPEAYTYNPAGTIGGISYGEGYWTNLGSGMNASVSSITISTNGMLYAAGGFTNAGGVAANRVAMWDGTSWTNLGSGLSQWAFSMKCGPGGSLYAGGAFTSAGGVTANSVAMWNGTSWTNLGAGLNSSAFDIDIDTNGLLYAAGDFTTAGGNAAEGIAVWDGSSWSSMSSGFSSRVYSVCIDSCGKIYTGGDFTNSGNASIGYVAVWNGSNWTNLANGLDGAASALTPALGEGIYAAGIFSTAGVVEANNVAHWNGISWSNLGNGLGDYSDDLIVGSQGFLYAAGFFTNAGSLATHHVAEWNGQSWTNLGNGLNQSAKSIAVGPNREVYVGGEFTNAGGIAANYIAKWHRNAITNIGVSPSAGSFTGDYAVTISGTNLCNGSDVTNVTLCGVNVDSIDSQNATQIVVTAGQAPIAGAGDVRVYSTSYGESIKSNAFEYLREQQDTLIFTPASPQAYLATNALSTSGGSGTGVVSYAVLSGPGTIVDSTNLTVTSGTGTIEVSATKAQDDRYYETVVTGTVTAAKAAGGVYLADLAQTYDGTARSVTATSDPSGLTIEFTYDGNAWAPTNAGSYAVTGSINDINYEGSATDTLVVDKADQTITFPPIDNQFWTNVVGLSATADSDLAVSFGVLSGPASISDDTNLSFSGYGSVSVTADQPGDDNWNAAATMTNTFSILGPGITLLGTNGAVIVSEEAPSIAKGTEFPRTMWHYPAFTNVFTITNSGTADLHIEGVTTNGSEYFRIVSWPTTVATQSTGNLLIAADPLTINTHTARVELAFNGTASPFALNLDLAVDPDVMSIWLPTQIVNGVERNIFDRDTWTVLQALTDLRDIVNQTNLTNIIVRFGGWPGYNPAFTNGDTARLEGDLDYLLDIFPLAPTVFTNGIAVGEKSFIDQNGDYFTTDQPHLFEPLPYTNTYTLILEAGRHTAAAGIAQLLENVELVTRNNRIQIQASDNTQTQAIDFAALADQLETNTTALSATASSGLDVSFRVDAGPAVLAGAISPTTMTYTNYGTAAIVAAQTGDVAYLPAAEITNRFRVFGIFTVTVASAHGTATPAPGPYLYVEESIITNTVSTPDTQDTTQYVCGGWTMTGNEPLSGPGTNCIMIVTNDAALTWQWSTNYWLAVSATTNGYVDAASGWFGFGTPLMITGTASNYYHFDQWTVIPGGANTNNPLNLTIDQPYGLVSTFAENLTTNTGTPEWWLASFGLTNFVPDAIGDNDSDGVPTWEEYIADTIPTNPASLLQIDAIGMGPGNRQVEWIGGTGVLQYLEWATNANDGSVWTVISTNTPPTPITNQVDVYEGQSEGFYRIRAVR